MTNYLNKMWLLYAFCLCACVMQQVKGDEFAECEGVADGSFVASLQSCQTYIYCSGEDSAAGDCDPGMYFDIEQGTCDAKENVRCLLDEVDEEPELEASEGEEPVEEEEEEAEENELEPSEAEVEEPIIVTNAPTTTTTGSVGTNPLDTLSVPTVVRATCPNSDDPNQIVLIANNESCSDYYLCYNGHATEMRCANQLHFNVNTGQCDYPENVQCAINRPNANKCLPHITDFFPHPDKCNYYYYCIKGYLTVQQCPFYYGWDIERRSCVQISQAKCFGSAKRI